MLPATFSQFVSTSKITFAVVASLDKGTVETVGDRKDLPSDDIVNQYFGDAETIGALNRSLEGQLMPRMISQGEVSCIVCKPSPDTIIGLLYTDDRNVVEKYRWSKKLNTELLKIWED